MLCENMNENKWDKLSYQTRCRTIGIEYDERIYEKAVENQRTAAVRYQNSWQLFGFYFNGFGMLKVRIFVI